jgi:exodeoxyribonuclease VII large subunit
VVPDRAEFLTAVRSGGRRLDGAVAALLRTTGREVSGERRALERLSPVAQLASARERVGLLLDRATRAVGGQVAERRRLDDRLAGRLAPTLPGRLARDRARVERASVLGPLATGRVSSARASVASAAAALGVLGPQATLDRGYAIVRRTDDGRIVRGPQDAPAGTRLALRVASGELPATVDEP